MSYDLHEGKKSAKFIKHHNKDRTLILRIKEAYIQVTANPYNPSYTELKSKKCPKCRRIRVGDYRIIFYISEKKKLVEIIDIIPRKDDYKQY